MSAPKPLVLYHGNCPDGFGAAYAAYLHFGTSAEYRPALYGTEPDVTGFDRIYLLDISYPRATLLRWAEIASVQVIDHHKTAAADLAGLCRLAGDVEPGSPLLGAIFDMEHSGAVLAYEYFHPGMPVPMFFSYIEDRDLWKWALPSSKEISAWLGSWPMAFMTWPSLADALEQQREMVVSSGAAILRAKQEAVRQMADRAIFRDVGGHHVPVVNTTVYFSEVGEELCLRFPDAPFAAYYFDRLNDGRRQWGLRSRYGFDCSVVAKAKGGGGHPGAAGFEEVL